MDSNLAKLLTVDKLAYGRYSVPENAEVISSIGVALAMVRDVVERVVPNPSPEDIRAIKLEAINKAVESGAEPSSVSRFILKLMRKHLSLQLLQQVQLRVRQLIY